MAGRPGTGKARAKGNIETLASGALRVRVYAGQDPVTKKRHSLIEVVPPGRRHGARPSTSASENGRVELIDGPRLRWLVQEHLQRDVLVAPPTGRARTWSPPSL